MAELVLLIFVIIIAVSIFGSIGHELQKEKSSQIEASDAAMKAEGFELTYQHRSPDAHALIAIDEPKSKLLLNIGDPKAHVMKHTLDLDKIISLEISENGKSLFSERSNLAGSLTGAALGGIVFGGAGAVVGAIAGKNKSQITNIDLILQVADPAVPYIKFNFLGNTKVKAGSDEHVKALEKAKEWAARIKAIQHVVKKTHL